MNKYTFSLNFLYTKKGEKVTITSLNSLDTEYIELSDVAADMFLFVVERSEKPEDLISFIMGKYTHTSEEQIRNDFSELIEFLLQKNILTT